MGRRRRGMEGDGGREEEGVVEVFVRIRAGQPKLVEMGAYEPGESDLLIDLFFVFFFFFFLLLLFFLLIFFQKLVSSSVLMMMMMIEERGLRMVEDDQLDDRLGEEFEALEVEIVGMQSGWRMRKVEDIVGHTRLVIRE
jgi:hypothetical protein